MFYWILRIVVCKCKRKCQCKCKKVPTEKTRNDTKRNISKWNQQFPRHRTKSNSYPHALVLFAVFYIHIPPTPLQRNGSVSFSRFSLPAACRTCESEKQNIERIHTKNEIHSIYVVYIRGKKNGFVWWVLEFLINQDKVKKTASTSVFSKFQYLICSMLKHDFERHLSWLYLVPSPARRP